MPYAIPYTNILDVPAESLVGNPTAAVADMQVIALASLPTTDPGIAGRLWVNPANAYALTVSQGSSPGLDFSDSGNSMYLGLI